MTRHDPDCRQRWLAAARRTALKVNAAWCLDRLMPVLVAAATACFALVYWLRMRGLPLSVTQSWPWLALGLIACMAAAVVLARRAFIGKFQALVRLEARLRLNNALSTAVAGHGAWPVPPARVADGWRWRRANLLAPLLAVAVGLSAFWLPLPPRAAALPTVEPHGWAEMEEWLKQLAKEKIISANEQRERLAQVDDLRSQAPGDWYSHQSLHAGDTLRENLQRDAAQLADQISKAAAALNQMRHAGEMPREAKERLDAELQAALDAVEQGDMELDPELREQLEKLAPDQLKNLTPEQMEQLRKSLKEKSGLCERLGKGLGPAEEGEDGEGEGSPGGEGDDPYGKGGPGRGPGAAPLTFSDEENRFDTNSQQALSSSDFSGAALGAKLGVQSGRHAVDQTPATSSSAGGVEQMGAGGEQVWRETLTPQEKAVLKRVFR